MDLTIDLNDYVLNVRAGAVIIKDNKILFHKNNNKSHYCVIGGRVEIGRTSEETAIREVKEEIGKDIAITGYVATLENFFYKAGKKYHEIYFLPKCELLDNNIDTSKVINNIEGKELKYYWLEIDKLDQYEIMPKELIEIFKDNQFPKHRIIKDDD